MKLVCLIPVPPGPAVLDISAALNLLLRPSVGTPPSQLQSASCLADWGSKHWLCLHHIPLIQQQSYSSSALIQLDQGLLGKKKGNQQSLCWICVKLSETLLAGSIHANILKRQTGPTVMYCGEDGGLKRLFKMSHKCGRGMTEKVRRRQSELCVNNKKIGKKKKCITLTYNLFLPLKQTHPLLWQRLFLSLDTHTHTHTCLCLIQCHLREL